MVSTSMVLSSIKSVIIQTFIKTYSLTVNQMTSVMLILIHFLIRSTSPPPSLHPLHKQPGSFYLSLSGMHFQKATSSSSTQTSVLPMLPLIQNLVLPIRLQVLVPNLLSTIKYALPNRIQPIPFQIQHHPMVPLLLTHFLLCDRTPTIHPPSDPCRCPGNSSLARPLAQSMTLHEVPTTTRLKTWPRLMAV